MTASSENLENRVLIFMPTGRDGLLVCTALKKLDIAAHACFSLEEFKLNLGVGCGAVLIAEEALRDGTQEYLAEMSHREPVWSDIPIVLFAGGSRNAEHLLATVGSRLNATIVERPIRITMLVSAVRGALRARERQYQTRDLLAQLEQADKQKDLFLATLSHELRTPLNSILGWIRLARNNPGKPADLMQALDVIERNAKIQSELISDILFISRVITGKLELTLEPINIVSTVQAAIDTASPSAKEKNISLNFSFEIVDETEAVEIKGDAERLQQVFGNLLSNAVKFTPEHGKIDVSVRQNGPDVAVEIRDNGRGIDPGFLPHIFERFRQADNSYSRTIGGLGLGLAIVRHLLELHNGQIGVESAGLGSGASFTVTLPVLARDQNAAGAPETGLGKDSKNKKLLKDVKLLLVEDDKDSREMLATAFGFYGMEVTTAASAFEALEAMENFQPQIIVSDVGLPGEDGYSLMRRIRSLPAGRGNSVPAIALTGYVSVQDQAAARDSGYQEHMSKPVDIDELAEIIFKLLKKK